MVRYMKDWQRCSSISSQNRYISAVGCRPDRREVSHSCFLFLMYLVFVLFPLEGFESVRREGRISFRDLL